MKQLTATKSHSLLVIAGISAIVAAAMIWASNNVDAVEDTIG